jgi:hypothetical protein
MNRESSYGPRLVDAHNADHDRLTQPRGRWWPVWWTGVTGSILSDAVRPIGGRGGAEQAGSVDRSLYQRLLGQAEARQLAGVPDRGSARGLWAGPPGEIYA